jgi:membrane-bound inhibitor of C-type lysozyme
MNTMARYILLAGLAFAVAAGCTTQEQHSRWTFVCPDGYDFTAVYARDGESVEVTAGDESFRLRRVRAASGARYAEGETEFWSKAAIARLQLLDGTMNPVIHENCQGDNS